MLELLCIIFKEGSQTEKWNQITPAYENKTTHTHIHNTVYKKHYNKMPKTSLPRTDATPKQNEGH